MAESNTETKLKRIVNEVLFARNNLKRSPIEEGELSEKIKNGKIHNLVENTQSCLKYCLKSY